MDSRATATPQRAVVLLSGGVDSTTVCAWLIDHGWTPFPLFVDYGQRAHAAEWRSARRVSTSLGAQAPRRLVLGKLGAVLPYELLGRRVAGARIDEYVPQRNMLLGTLAAMYAESLGARAIALGVVGTAPDQYRDTTRGFIDKLGRALRQSAKLRVLAPFADRSKSELLSFGFRRGVDYRLTWSCSARSDRHCRRCGSCRERFDGLREFPARSHA